MSAPIRFERQPVINASTGRLQLLAKQAGVSRRQVFLAAIVHRHGCPELILAAHSGQLAIKHCATLAKALPHTGQREWLAELPSMTPRQRHDRLAAIKEALRGKGVRYG